MVADGIVRAGTVDAGVDAFVGPDVAHVGNSDGTRDHDETKGEDEEVGTLRKARRVD